MDHKQFFQDFGKLTLRNVDSEYTLEQLYQAIKARLIEELRAQVKLPYHIDHYAHLIDTGAKTSEGGGG